MAQTNIPNAEERINKRDRDVPWYAVELHDSLSPNTRKLLEEYSHIPADEVEKHVYEIVRRHVHCSKFEPTCSSSVHFWR